VHEIPAVIETSAKIGMISSSRAMVDLVRKKEISLKNATDFAQDPGEIKNLLK
jgi:Tfp pilus assembly pilus retraction ATPase PilT